jgi:hypothetical protein
VIKENLEKLAIAAKVKTKLLNDNIVKYFILAMMFGIY